MDFMCPIGSLEIDNVAQRVGECSVRELHGFSVLECVKTGQHEVSLIVSCVSLYFVLEHPVLTHSTKKMTRWSFKARGSVWQELFVSKLQDPKP